MSEIREVYLNPVQYKLINSFEQTGKKIAVGVCGRGLGKSTIGGEYLDRCQSTMPRSRGFIAGPTMDAIKNRILPSVQEHWERIGIIEGQDYLVGKKPPKTWDSPKNRVEDYKNIISFPNGTAISLISLYAEGAARGGSFQFGFVDEALSIKRENFGSNILPAMRGLRFDVAKLLLYEEGLTEEQIPFGQLEKDGLETIWKIPFAENPYYLSIMIVSSMPFTQRGMWILDYEDNEEAFYIEGTALDNIVVLGPQYIPNLQASMTKLEFDVEVMNKRLDTSPDSFYHQWNDERHILEHDPYRDAIELEISFDFGRFMCMTVNQYIEGRAVTIRVFYVTNGSIGDLLDEFQGVYQDHLVKQIRIHGDVQGNRPRNPELDNRSIYQEIIDYLRVRGWAPIHIPNRYNPAHMRKHMILNKALEENKANGLPAVRIYEQAAKALILSMKHADAKESLQKDKSSEHPNSGIDQAEATHLSDAWDYWYMDRFSHLYRNTSNGDFSIL